MARPRCMRVDSGEELMLADSSEDETAPEEVFSGVFPIKKQRTASTSNQAVSTAAFFYNRGGGAATDHPAAPAPQSADTEQALMAAMGLPIALKAGTPESSDAYQVWASDPSASLSPMSLQPSGCGGSSGGVATTAPALAGGGSYEPVCTPASLAEVQMREEQDEARLDGPPSSRRRRGAHSRGASASDSSIHGATRGRAAGCAAEDVG